MLGLAKPPECVKAVECAVSAGRDAAKSAGALGARSGLSPVIVVAATVGAPVMVGRANAVWVGEGAFVLGAAATSMSVDEPGSEEDADGLIGGVGPEPRAGVA